MRFNNNKMYGSKQSILKTHDVNHILFQHFPDDQTVHLMAAFITSIKCWLFLSTLTFNHSDAPGILQQ